MSNTYKSEYARVKKIISSLFLGIVFGFIIGGVIGFVDGGGIMNLENYRNFLIGKDLIFSMHFSYMQVSILSWGFSFSILGTIVSGVMAIFVHDNYLLETKSVKKEILDAHKQISLATV